jgi:type II secretory ATPase GspE/PulE/Tfp pilus assembly ATPase PilB-like protein
VCDSCKIETEPVAEEIEQIGIRNGVQKVAMGRGCPKCLNSGYYDRTAIYEILPISDIVRDMVMARASSSMIKNKAIELGMRTLRMDGARKVIAGLTTPKEVMLVTQMDSI